MSIRDDQHIIDGVVRKLLDGYEPEMMPSDWEGMEEQFDGVFDKQIKEGLASFEPDMMLSDWDDMQGMLADAQPSAFVRYRRYLSAAACLLLLLGVGWFVNNNISPDPTPNVAVTQGVEEESAKLAEKINIDTAAGTNGLEEADNDSENSDQLDTELKTEQESIQNADTRKDSQTPATNFLAADDAKTDQSSKTGNQSQNKTAAQEQKDMKFNETLVNDIPQQLVADQGSAARDQAATKQMDESAVIPQDFAAGNGSNNTTSPFDTSNENPANENTFPTAENANDPAKDANSMHNEYAANDILKDENELPSVAELALLPYLSEEIVSGEEALPEVVCELRESTDIVFNHPKKMKKGWAVGLYAGFSQNYLDEGNATERIGATTAAGDLENIHVPTLTNRGTTIGLQLQKHLNKHFFVDLGLAYSERSYESENIHSPQYIHGDVHSTMVSYQQLETPIGLGLSFLPEAKIRPYVSVQWLPEFNLREDYQFDVTPNYFTQSYSNTTQSVGDNTTYGGENTLAPREISPELLDEIQSNDLIIGHENFTDIEDYQELPGEVDYHLPQYHISRVVLNKFRVSAELDVGLNQRNALSMGASYQSSLSKDRFDLIFDEYDVQNFKRRQSLNFQLGWKYSF